MKHESNKILNLQADSRVISAEKADFGRQEKIGLKTYRRKEGNALMMT
jgi:hypothetical protein